MSIAALSGITANRGTVTVPAWGTWYADVTLEEPKEFAKGTAVSLVVADKTMSGVVVSGGVFNGRAAYRVVGGKGGWGATIPRKGYSNDLGLKISQVLSDAAATAGETIQDLPATKLGPHYVRAEGPAYQVLQHLAPKNWYVDFAGVTHFGQRSNVTYSGEGVRDRVSPSVGVVELAVESLAQLEPGVVVDGYEPATDVEIVWTDTRLTARVYYAPKASRRLEALRAIILGLFPSLRYSGVWEYRVVTQSGERLNLQPVRVSSGMPDLSNVPVRPGVAGVKAGVTLGEQVLVCFADNDPSRPQVFAHDAADAPGWMPLTLQLGEDPALGVARMTDAVVAGPFGGTIVGASARISAGL